MNYDSEGNPIEIEEEKPIKKIKRKLRKKQQIESDSSDDADGGPSNPFAVVENPVVGDINNEKNNLREVVEFDNDMIPDGAIQNKTHLDKKDSQSKAAELAAYRRIAAKQEQKESAMKRSAMKRNKNSIGNAMGHFSNPASDTSGILADGIYFWNNMGLGKMPLKVKKQWQGKSDVNPKRARQMGHLPRE